MPAIKGSSFFRFAEILLIRSLLHGFRVVLVEVAHGLAHAVQIEVLGTVAPSLLLLATDVLIDFAPFFFVVAIRIDLRSTTDDETVVQGPLLFTHLVIDCKALLFSGDFQFITHVSHAQIQR